MNRYVPKILWALMVAIPALAGVARAQEAAGVLGLEEAINLATLHSDIAYYQLQLEAVREAQLVGI